ncbi:MAG: fumarylacetoacetate hydrolase family protein [Proteobacteria bacterium]|nr:fumarylacetoacetate hydrolase family protein [Pseudomonadota bacterium]
MKIGRVSHLKSGEILEGIFEDNSFYPFEESLISYFEKHHSLEGIKISKKAISITELKILTPTVPSKIVAIGLNYREHAKEFGKEVPDEPLIFFKPPSALIAHGEEILIPTFTKRVDYEGELAIVIGKTCKNVSEESAREYVLGYSCFNDVTERVIQKKDGQYSRAKGIDTFAPYGPYIATNIDPSSLEIKTLLNGRTVQHSNTKDQIFSPFFLVSFISKYITLLPGDIIPTGTPSGVGPLKDGDTVEVVIEKVGVLRNKVRSI